MDSLFIRGQACLRPEGRHVYELFLNAFSKTWILTAIYSNKSMNPYSVQNGIAVALRYMLLR
jgi:hypothetical protein